MKLTVNVALAFVCLRHEEIRHMPADMILVANCIPAEHFLKSTIMSVTLPISKHELTLTSSH
jgi:hypothetical protein